MANKHSVITLTTPIQRRALALLDQGVSASAAAKSVGANVQYVRDIARVAGFALGTKHRDLQAQRRATALALLSEGVAPREAAQRAGMSLSRLYAINPNRKTRGLRIPKWVPAGLHQDYVDFARQFDEHYAASQVRRLKAEAA